MDIVWQFFWGLLALATKAAVALYILFRMLTYANNKQGVSVKEMLEKLNEDPRAVADYYGRRLIAAALVIMGISIGTL